MRMPLTAILLLLFFSGSADPAEVAGVGVQGSAEVGYYQSSDGVSVTSPSVDASLAPDPRTTLTLRYDLDAVSAASFNYAGSKTHANSQHAPGTCYTCHSSVDALSGATRNYGEQRQAVTLGARRRVGEAEARVTWFRGEEHDYRSDELSLGFSQDLAGRDSTLDVDIHHRSDLVGAVWNPAFQQPRDAVGGALGLTQVLSSLSQLKLVLDYEDTEGDLADPYAFIEVGSQGTLPYPATAPQQRQRWDLDLAYKQGLPWGGAGAEADYRYYTDTWDVRAHTLGLSLSQELGSWVLEPGLRYYTQTRAFFFQNRYAQAQAYMTRDLKLADFSTWLASLSLQGPLWGSLQAELRYTHFLRQDQLDYAGYFASTPVSADTFQLGLSLQ
jgi:hypothetical protein